MATLGTCFYIIYIGLREKTIESIPPRFGEEEHQEGIEFLGISLDTFLAFVLDSASNE